MPRNKRIGLYGGTFDPPHNAHLSLAKWILEYLALDNIYFIPTAIHAFKDRQNITPQEIRFEMLEKAIGSHPDFLITKIEFDRPAVSYTVDTLENFCNYERVENVKLFYIIGIDNFLEFPLWKDPAKILKLAQLVVMKRPGYSISPHIQQYVDYVKLLETPLFDTSSTRIRNLVSSGLPYEHLVPAGVVNIIKKHCLYQSV